MPLPASIQRARESLPTDPAVLPALGAGYDRALDGALTSLGLHVTPALRAALEIHARLLMAWNRSINLTAIDDPERIAVEHVADSLAAVPVLRDVLGERTGGTEPALLDLGSGGGYPGLPVALVLPASRAALVDSIGKKARFLRVAADAAARAIAPTAPELEVLALRAEDLAHDTKRREGWDVVVVRAVGPFAELVELALPLLRRDGLLVSWKRDDGSGTLGAELSAARRILQAAGGGRPVVRRVGVPGLRDHRLVLVRKARPTPSRLPRPRSERRRPLLP